MMKTSVFGASGALLAAAALTAGLFLMMMAKPVTAEPAGGGSDEEMPLEDEPKDVASEQKGKIAFRSNRDGNNEIYVMNTDGTGQTRLTNDPADDSMPAFSPLSADGSKIAFVRDEEIWVMNADGTDQIKLTFNNSPGYDSAPVWSPDGSKIAFSRSLGGNPEIYVMNADGSDQKNLTNFGSASDFYPAFSSDGSKIAFQSDRDGNPEIYVMNADGTGQTRLTNDPAQDLGPTFSPGGSKITFRSDRNGDAEIYVMNSDGSDQKNLTNFGSAHEAVAAWSPDGTKIAFGRWYGCIDICGEPTEVYVMDSDGSDQKNLTNNRAWDSAPHWGVVPATPTDSTAPPWWEGLKDSEEPPPRTRR